MSMRNVLLCASIALSTVAMPAAAQVYVTPPAPPGVIIRVAPPAPRFEVVPAPRPGYIWAPGYWGWEGERHVWRGGRHVEARPGHHWVADGWHAREGRHHFAPGRWEQGHEGKENGRGKGHNR